MVRFGIVGFGLHAVKRMMPAFALAKNSKAVALSRRTMEKAKESSAKWNIPLAFDSAAELARSPEVDAVFVTTPNKFHFTDVLTVVAAGKPVLCEKPLAMNAGECQQMVEAATKANVPFGVAHIFRFEDSVATIRKRIAAGQIGTPIFARSEFCFPGGTDHPRKWLHDMDVAGGGPIVDIGVHCVDTLRYILQDDIIKVSARDMHDQLSGAMEAAAILLLEFSRGTLATVSVSFRSGYRTPLEFVGTDGVLFADNGLTVERPINIQLLRNGQVVESKTVSNTSAYAAMLDSFADSLEGKGRFPAPAEEGWQNQEILDAAYRSLKSGNTEVVPKIK
ncbi:MAG TPA: Gfo/Idh/MocA family oxidoreductase [Terriglobales bacterium]